VREVLRSPALEMTTSIFHFFHFSLSSPSARYGRSVLLKRRRRKPFQQCTILLEIVRTIKVCPTRQSGSDPSQLHPRETHSTLSIQRSYSIRSEGADHGLLRTSLSLSLLFPLCFEFLILFLPCLGLPKLLTKERRLSDIHGPLSVTILLVLAVCCADSCSFSPFLNPSDLLSALSVHYDSRSILIFVLQTRIVKWSESGNRSIHPLDLKLESRTATVEINWQTVNILQRVQPKSILQKLTTGKHVNWEPRRD